MRAERRDRAGQVRREQHHVVDVARRRWRGSPASTGGVVGRGGGDAVERAVGQAGRWVRPRSDQPRMRLPPSRPTSRTRTVPMRQRAVVVDREPGRLPRLPRVYNGLGMDVAI